MTDDYDRTKSGLKMDGPYVVRETDWLMGLFYLDDDTLTERPPMPVGEVPNRAAVDDLPVPRDDPGALAFDLTHFTGLLSGLYFHVDGECWGIKMFDDPPIRVDGHTDGHSVAHYDWEFILYHLDRRVADGA